MKKVHRFIGNYQLGLGTMRLDDAALADQMRVVLKLAPGELVVVGDGTGQEAHCRILGFDRGAVLVQGLSLERNLHEPAVKATLYLAVLKADHFELAASKATEVGVHRIVPILTARTVKTGLRSDRLRRIVRESAELAGRGLVPEVEEIRDLQSVWADASKNDANYFYDPSGTPKTTSTKRTGTAGIFIGPEGGWEQEEVARATDMGMQVISLGGLVLRSDTAATVTCFMVAHSMKV